MRIGGVGTCGVPSGVRGVSQRWGLRCVLRGADCVKDPVIFVRATLPRYSCEVYSLGGNEGAFSAFFGARIVSRILLKLHVLSFLVIPGSCVR